MTSRTRSYLMNQRFIQKLETFGEPYKRLKMQLCKNHILTLAPLGYSTERAPLGGGADSDPLLSNSGTDGRRKTGKTANESSQ